MKEIYDWVPWFNRLAQKINEGGEVYLAERAKRVKWIKETPALLEFGDENIDPFSFFYFLAQCNGLKRREEVYKSVDDVFEIERKDLLSNQNMNDGFIIPTPTFPVKALFNDNGKGNPVLLWKLFRDAINDIGKINSEDFKNTLDIHNVDVAKLTQCLFLINPKGFMPIDKGILNFHDALNLPSFRDARTELKGQDGWEKYQLMLEKFKSAFSGCSFYEINTVLYLLGTWEKTKSPLLKKFFQISSNVYDESKDYWKEFAEKNCVRTGGRASSVPFHDTENPKKPYPLTEPSKGDIILVRFGIKNGRAIGVVYKNDYAEKGLTEENSIHVLWLNKSPAGLAGETRQHAFESVSKNSQTYKSFAEVEEYKPTFNLIRYLNDQKSENNQSGNVIQPKNVMKYPLNQIFYGPPGTGKTYRTINASLKILDENFYEKNKENREKLQERYADLKREGRIEFITFHQSFGYEEFVEGIRPVMDGEEGGEVSFEIMAGVFKKICERAASVKPFLPFEDAIEKLKEECAIESEFGKPITMKTPVQNRDRDVWYEAGRRSFQMRVGTSKDAKPFPISIDRLRKIYQKPGGGETGPRTIINYLKENYGLNDQPCKEGRKDYVLIIDEINRGNISRIFGELITLIEESKRLGEREAATVTLPYSRESFGVPNNLYIIGTMNTADRSIAMLDTALRRRFRFQEMMPDGKKLEGVEIDGVSVPLLLNAMNERIESLYDRDHQIGHSNFMRLKDSPDIETLDDIFRHEILPLLQEYFYDDWAKIDLVLNRNGFLKSESPAKPPGNNILDTDKMLWKINPDQFTVDDYKKIYQNSADE